MREYIIMTDSNADLSKEEVREMELKVLPFCFTFDGDGKVYRDTPDHVDMSLEEFYRRIKAEEGCTSSAVSVGAFRDAMRVVLEEGKDILCICFSSGMSTAYQSACIAAEEMRATYPEASVVVLDSLCASRGQGLFLHYAVLDKRSGMSLEAVAEAARARIPHLCHWFTVADLNHLKRGGRVSPTTAFVGSMLNIKPVLHVDDEGHLIPMSKARGMKNALKSLADKMEEIGRKPLSEQTIFISHSGCIEYAEQLITMLQERFGIKDIRCHYIGPVIGTHTGWGTVALFFLGEHR